MPVPHTVELPHECTEAEYFYWNDAEIELRAFLLATTRGMRPWFAHQEAVADEEANSLDPQTRDGSEGYEVFMDNVGIFWSQYWEHIAAFVIKEAFKHFEVFLESSAIRILRFYKSGLVKADTDDSWNFNDCKRFYSDYLEINVLPEPIANIKWIRDKLSHLEKLRTEEGKQKLESHLEALGLNTLPTPGEEAMDLYHDDWIPTFGNRFTFTPVQTWRVLQLLRAHVNALAPDFHDFCWPRHTKRTTQMLVDLIQGKAVNPYVSNKKPGDSLYLKIPNLTDPAVRR